MPRSCSVCSNDRRAEIDAALVSGQSSLRTLAVAYSLSPSALQRHRLDHISRALLVAKKDSDLSAGRALVNHLHLLHTRVSAVLDRAEQAGDLRTAVSAARELRGLLAFAANLNAIEDRAVSADHLQAYVNDVVQIIHEFVPPDRIAAAVSRLTRAR